MKIDWHRRNKVIRARQQPEFEQQSGVGKSMHPRALMPTKDVLKPEVPLPLTKAQEKANRKRAKKKLKKWWGD